MFLSFWIVEATVVDIVTRFQDFFVTFLIVICTLTLQDFTPLDMGSDPVEKCSQVLQESLQTMEKELGMEAGNLDLKHCGILVEIAKDTYKVIEESLPI